MTIVKGIQIESRTYSTCLVLANGDQKLPQKSQNVHHIVYN